MDNPWASRDGEKAIEVIGWPGSLRWQSFKGRYVEAYWSMLGIRVPCDVATAVLNQHAMERLRSRLAWGEIGFENREDYSVEISHTYFGRGRECFHAPTLAEALIQAVLKEKQDE